MLAAHVAGATAAGRWIERTMKQVARYHPLLVALHWLLAFLIIAALFAGFFLLAAMPNSDPQKIRVLLVHMAAGMTILALMIIRFIVRMLTSRPAPATTGHPFLDRVAPVTHYGFYVLVLLMVVTGYATAILAEPQQDRLSGFGRAIAGKLCGLSDLHRPWLHCARACRLHCLAHAGGALSPAHSQGPIVPADVVRQASGKGCGFGRIIPPCWPQSDGA
jgi:cytochrome b561